MTKALKAAIAALLALGLSGCNNTTRVSQIAENAGRFHTEAGTVYMITDTRTNVQYLAWSYHDYGAGVCVLVDADGKPLLAGDASD